MRRDFVPGHRKDIDKLQEIGAQGRERGLLSLIGPSRKGTWRLEILTDKIWMVRCQFIIQFFCKRRIDVVPERSPSCQDRVNGIQMKGSVKRQNAVHEHNKRSERQK